MEDYGLEVWYTGAEPVVAEYVSRDDEHSTLRFWLTTGSVVFVHGLGGNRTRTWDCDGVVWPRDLLPKNVGSARVMSVCRAREHNASGLATQLTRGSGATTRMSQNSRNPRASTMSLTMPITC